MGKKWNKILKILKTYTNIKFILKLRILAQSKNLRFIQNVMHIIQQSFQQTEIKSQQSNFHKQILLQMCKSVSFLMKKSNTSLNFKNVIFYSIILIKTIFFNQDKNQSTFDLFQGEHESLDNRQNKQDNICQSQKIHPTAIPNIQIFQKYFNQLDTQFFNQKIPFIGNNILKQQEIEIKKFLKQEEQETQEYMLMFENNQTVNKNKKMNELTIQAFMDQDLKSKNQNELDKQTQSYKILNELEIVQNKQNKLDQEQNDTIQQAGLQTGNYLQNQQQHNLDIKNTTNDFQIKRKLNNDDKEEEDEKYNNFDLDKQTQSYKILNELEIVLNKQNKLDQQQNDTIQQAGLQTGNYIQNQQQHKLEIKNTTIDFQINRKLNDDEEEEEEEEEEEKEQFQNQTKSSNQNNLLNSQIQNKDSNLSLIQNLIFKESNDLLKIGHLGKGGQAGVEFYYDFKQKKRFALKNFENQYEYLQEKKTHIKYLLEDKNPKLSSFVCQLISFDDQKCQILLEIGLCSLLDAYKTLKKNNLQINIQFFVNILIKMISFNIQMNRVGLYHSDIKPQNMVLYLDQNELSAQHQFGFQLADFEYIQLKFIDFASCSDDPDYYYQYQTPKYKYYGYQNQNLDFKQILFAETYSACKSVYYLLDEKLQQRIQIISCDSQFQEVSEENNFLFFLQIFLGDNEVNRKLSKVGISADELISLTEKHLGKTDELNNGFKCDFINVLQVGQWQNISDIENNSNNSSTEYQIFQAFAFINKLEDIFNEKNIQSQNIDYKMQCINSLLQYIDITILYKSFTEEQLNFILKIVLQKSTALSKEQYLQFIQCACFLYCHSEKDHYQKCIEAIKETQNDLINQNENSEIQEIVYDVFLSIINNVKVDTMELIERIYLLEIEIQKQHSLIYEFLITYIVETQNEFDEQTAFIMLNILEQLKSSKNLNNFQLKLFNHIYLYFLHLTIKDEHKKYCQNFQHYKQICKELNLILEQDTIIFLQLPHIKVRFQRIRICRPRFKQIFFFYIEF
ncbi:hypothetical protein ABPG74_010504 [Tetrahymena malaccensis]